MLSKALELLPDNVISKKIVEEMLNAGLFVTVMASTVQATATGDMLPLMPIAGAAASMAMNKVLGRFKAFNSSSEDVKSKIRFAVSAACASASYGQVSVAGAAFSAATTGYALTEVVADAFKYIRDAREDARER